MTSTSWRSDNGARAARRRSRSVSRGGAQAHHDLTRADIPTGPSFQPGPSQIGFRVGDRAREPAGDGRGREPPGTRGILAAGGVPQSGQQVSALPDRRPERAMHRDARPAGLTETAMRSDDGSVTSNETPAITSSMRAASATVVASGPFSAIPPQLSAPICASTTPTPGLMPTSPQAPRGCGSSPARHCPARPGPSPRPPPPTPRRPARRTAPIPWITGDPEGTVRKRVDPQLWQVRMPHHDGTGGAKTSHGMILILPGLRRRRAAQPHRLPADRQIIFDRHRTPASRRSPRSARASISPASLSASADLTRTNAPSSALTFAIRYRCSATTPRAVTCVGIGCRRIVPGPPCRGF